MPNGAATAADCELTAVGPFADDRFAGRLVPFESDMSGMSAADLGDDPPEITVAIGPDGATLSDDQGAANRYCPMNSDVTGLYRKG